MTELSGCTTTVQPPKGDLAMNAADLSADLSVAFDPNKAMSDALHPVEQELAELARVLAPLTSAQTHTAKDVISHVLKAGGKRIRPALYFLTARLVGYQDKHLHPMAAVCEFVHTASLLHDDVIDNSTLRRNKPTANSIWGDEASVLTGDLIYARASELMAETGSLQIVSLFARAIRLMSEGELLQLEHLYDPEMPESHYFKIIENKTAALLSATCKAPAILNGCTIEQQEALARFGYHVGFAFQLLDDALDYAGLEPIFGKKTLADLPEGKVTWPVILLRSVSSNWQSIANIIRKVEIRKSDMEKVMAEVETFATHEKTLELAAEHTQKALDSLTLWPESSARQHMESLVKIMLLRTT
jgi:octaprenyl-diphosphate synthase